MRHNADRGALKTKQLHNLSAVNSETAMMKSELRRRVFACSVNRFRKLG